MQNPKIDLSVFSPRGLEALDVLVKRSVEKKRRLERESALKSIQEMIALFDISEEELTALFLNN